MKKNRKTFVAFIGLSLIVLVLSSCSGMIGGYDGLEVRVAGLSDGRFISGSANSGYIVLLQKDRIFSLNIIDGAPFSAWITGGVARIPAVPAGDYILGVVLMDDNATPEELSDDTNWGLSIKEITIEKGYNSINVDVGPGISLLTLNGVLFDDFMTPDGYKVGFETDTIIFYTNELAGTIAVNFRDGYGSFTSGVGVSSYTASPGPYSLTIKRFAP